MLDHIPQKPLLSRLTRAGGCYSDIPGLSLQAPVQRYPRWRQSGRILQVFAWSGDPCCRRLLYVILTIVSSQPAQVPAALHLAKASRGSGWGSPGTNSTRRRWSV